MNPNTLGRLLNLLDYALSSLRRKALKNVFVFIVFAFVVFLFSSFQLVSRGLTETAGRILNSVPDITVQQMSAGRQVSLPVSAMDELQSLYGIKKIQPRIWGYYFDESSGANYTVIGAQDVDLLEVTAKATSIDTSQLLTSGRLPEQGERGKVVVSGKVAKLLNLQNRSHFSLFRPDLSQSSFEAVGIFSSSLDIVSGDLIYMGLEDARSLFAIDQESVTDFLITSGNPAEIETIARKIQEKLAGVRVITKNQILKTYKVVFSWRSGLGLLILMTTLFAFVILAWDKASAFSREDERETGVLKLVGWQTADIISLRFIESLILSVLAFSTGYLLSWIHVLVFDGGLYRPVMLGWSVLRPGLHFSSSFAVSDVLLLVSITAVPYLCATTLPGWRAASVRTDSVV
jgi:ABC-type lipoprotein release transport system permease subunit